MPWSSRSAKICALVCLGPEVGLFRDCTVIVAATAEAVVFFSGYAISVIL